MSKCLRNLLLGQIHRCYYFYFVITISAAPLPPCHFLLIPDFLAVVSRTSNARLKMSWCLPLFPFLSNIIHLKPTGVLTKMQILSCPHLGILHKALIVSPVTKEAWLTGCTTVSSQVNQNWDLIWFSVFWIPPPTEREKKSGRARRILTSEWDEVIRGQDFQDCKSQIWGFSTLRQRKKGFGRLDGVFQ